MAATVFHEEAGLNVRKVDLERVGDGRVLQSLGLTLSHNHPKVSTDPPPHPPSLPPPRSPSPFPLSRFMFLVHLCTMLHH